MTQTSSGTGETPFYDLSPEEVRSLLSRSSVGRIAFSHGNKVDVEPIGFIYSNGWLFGRTSLGTKLAALGHRPWVAFEVDDVKGPFDWESVVIHGSFHILAPEGTEYDKEIHDRALAVLSGRIPNYGTDKDPGAFRTTIFGIHMTELVGRGARSSPR